MENRNRTGEVEGKGTGGGEDEGRNALRMSIWSTPSAERAPSTSFWAPETPDTSAWTTTTLPLPASASILATTAWARGAVESET